MFLTAIVAMDRKGLIGANGKIPWHLPSDLKRFRRLTIGKPVIMGRKTWESLPGPLEGRTNIVMTRNPDYKAENATVLHHTSAGRVMAEREGYEASIIGGAEVYKAFWNFRRICLTVVDGDFEGDTYFPLHLLEGRHWKVVYIEDNISYDKTYTYYELIEKRQPGEGVHEIWHWVDRKAYEEAAGR